MYRANQIKSNPRIMDRLVKKLNVVYKLCQKDENYFAPLAKILQKACNIPSVDATDMIIRGLKNGVFVREGKHKEGIRLLAEPNEELISIILPSRICNKRRIVNYHEHAENMKPGDAFEKILPKKTEKELEEEWLTRFKSAEIVKEAKRFGFTIVLTKPIKIEI